MARKAYDQLLHCNVCGEDYSATYKRCPFCGAREESHSEPEQDDEDDGYVFDGQDLFDEPAAQAEPKPKGGRRLLTAQDRGGSRRSGGGRTASGGKREPRPTRGGGDDRPPEPVNWPRLITFLCSLVIIIAALIIIFTVVYPQLHKDPASNPSKDPVSVSDAPSQQPSPLPSEDPDVSPEPSLPPLTGLAFGRTNDYDFTLKADESHTIRLVTQPEDWPGTVTWASSDERYAVVSADGTVTNVNSTDTLRPVIITASAEGVTVTATVYCRAGSSGGATQAPTQAPSQAPTPSPEPSPEPSAAPSPSGSSGQLAPGTRATVTGASGGLRVRSGPGTSYEILASLLDGNHVTIVSDAGDGWYEITFTATGGVQTTGYVMGDFLTAP